MLTLLSRSPNYFHHTGADIKAVCTEAGLLALRERRMRVTQEDFVKAKEKTLYRKKGNIPEGLYL
jgi:26S proteasome regulatory subunit T2